MRESPAAFKACPISDNNLFELKHLVIPILSLSTF